MAETLRAAAAAVPLPIDTEQEAELRVVAVVIEAGERVCLAVTDSITIPADVLADARAAIASAGIPVSHQLLTATHTHHAPPTIDILGCRRDAAFCERLRQALPEAVRQACATLDDRSLSPEQTAAALWFAESQEATVGMNSRYLLADGTICWHRHRWSDVVRPTGPFDPDLPVFALRRGDGSTVAVLFNHGNHNIGTLRPGVRSPGFYGLAAQELERRHGGVCGFLPGAFGSSHNTGPFGRTENLHAVSPAECVHRVVSAVEEGLREAEPLMVGRPVVIQRPFTYRIRHFDEATEAEAVRYWAEHYDPERSARHQQIFAEMRAEMAPHAGEKRQTSLQVMVLDGVALVGLPGEIFASLGLRLRRRSPFRHTYVVGLANDTIGYVGDREAYDLGGYQLWPGWHSAAEPGTGEAMIDQALEMLHEAAHGKID